MFRSLRQRTARRLASVEFCDRCASVCDARCRAERRREATRLQASLWGGR